METELPNRISKLKGGMSPRLHFFMVLSRVRNSRSEVVLRFH